jgi:hypothetical protein
MNPMIFFKDAKVCDQGSCFPQGVLENQGIWGELIGKVYWENNFKGAFSGIVVL